MKNGLNPRQWTLYNLLKNNPDHKFKQSEIAAILPDLYDYDKDRKKGISFHDSAARLLITKDIQIINRSTVIQKIIISDNSGVKLASKEEFETYINRQFASIFRRLERTRIKARKGGLDGQYRFTFDSERETIEAFTANISRLKAARKAKNMKLAEVTAALRSMGEDNLDVSLLSKMENGYCMPTETQVRLLARIYAVEPWKLCKV